MRRESHAPRPTVYIEYKKLNRVAKELLSSPKPKDVDLGLAIAIGIRTGLRKSDLMVLDKSQFKQIGEQYFLIGVARKTGKPYKKPLPKYLYDIATRASMPLIYSRTYAHNWLGRSLQRLFPKEFAEALKSGNTISAHTLRKSYGMHLYRAYSINEARNGLQHTDTAVTSRYLNLPQQELIEKEACLFV